MHESHRTRFEWETSSYDYICELCGTTDEARGWGRLAEPCSADETRRLAYDAYQALRLAYKAKVTSATWHPDLHPAEYAQHEWGLANGWCLKQPTEDGLWRYTWTDAAKKEWGT